MLSSKPNKTPIVNNANKKQKHQQKAKTKIFNKKITIKKPNKKYHKSLNEIEESQKQKPKTKQMG